MTHPSSESDIKSEAELRALFNDTHEIAVKKCLTTLDKHCREFIAKSPFLCLSTQHANGTADVSPRGDPRGFVKVLDDKTIAIPDRPGNNRLDSLSNIVTNPSVALLFMIPGFEDTLRVNGTARLNQDADLLESMAVNGRTPKLAIVITVNEAFLHCAKALRRAKLWNVDEQLDRSEMASMISMVLEQAEGKPIDSDAKKVAEESLEEEYQQTMY